MCLPKLRLLCRSNTYRFVTSTSWKLLYKGSCLPFLLIYKDNNWLCILTKHQYSLLIKSWRWVISNFHECSHFVWNKLQFFMVENWGKLLSFLCADNTGVSGLILKYKRQDEMQEVRLTVVQSPEEHRKQSLTWLVAMQKVSAR